MYVWPRLSSRQRLAWYRIFFGGLLRVTFGTLLALLLVGCDQEDGDSKKLRVATSGDNPPYEFYEAGTLTGFDIDLMRAIGRKMGREIQFVDMDFGGIIPALQSNKAELAIAALTPTPEREKSVDFSTSYYQAPHGLLTVRGLTVRSSQDMKNMRIGVQLGATHAETANAFVAAHPTASIVALNKLPDLVQALKVDQVDGVLLGYSEACAFSEQDGAISTHPITDLPCATGNAIAFDKGSALREEVDRALEALVQDGTLDALKEKWKLIKGSAYSSE